MAGLYHPASGLLLWIAFFLHRFALAADNVRDVAVGQDDLHGALAPVPCIGAQVLGAALLGVRALDHDGIEHCRNLRHVMCVGSGHDERQRDATPVHQQMAFASVFSPDPSDSGQQLLVPMVP